MTSHVVATAGHVDHGKSTLVRALTGMEPDRWEAERRRGLTIDLGFVWTTLAPGLDVSFVDVPGHERFLGNALAGLGPASTVCFVVAADAGWQPQSSDHRDVIAALGIDSGVVVLTRSDRVERVDGVESGRIARTAREAREQLAGTGLADAPLVVTSAVTGEGLDEMRRVLAELFARSAPPPQEAPLRLWLDRAFTVTGAGTVVTGTLQGGTIGRDDRLRWHGHAQSADVTVRGLQSRGADRERVAGGDRVAVNLRGTAAAAAARGDVLLGPGPWRHVTRLDVRRTWGEPFGGTGAGVRVHVGTAVVGGRLRPLDADFARLTLERALPLVPGDRLLLRAPHSRAVLAGVEALDLAPPELTRRGDARRRAAALASPEDSLAARLARTGSAPLAELEAAGLVAADTAAPPGVRVVTGHWVAETAWESWREQLAALAARAHAADPLGPGPSRGEVAAELGLPEPMLSALAAEAGLVERDGRILSPGHVSDLGGAEAAVAEVEQRLAAEPFAAPEADELAALGLGRRELAAAERAGRLLRIASGVVLTPQAPARAMAVLAGLPGPFTVSEVRRALGTTRRVAVPLLELLDGRGWTRRLSGSERVVVRRTRD